MCLARTRHTFGLFCCLLETLLLSGSIHGFISLIPMLQRDGVYYDICTNLTRPHTDGNLAVLYQYDCSVLWTVRDELYRWFRCEEEERMFTLIFTVAVFLSSFLMPFFGWVYDNFGTWIVRIIASVLLIVGNMMAAFTDRALSDLIGPAMVFTTLGGLIILMTNFQLANTFYTKRSIWLGVYVCLYFMSSGVFMAAKALSEHFDMARRYLFFILLSTAILPICTTFCLHPINRVTENEYDIAIFTASSHIKMNSKRIHRETMNRDNERGEKTEDDDDDDFWMKDRKIEGVICSLSYFLHAVWFSVLQGQCWIMTSLRYILIPINNNEAYLHKRDEVFCYVQFSMGLAAILLGLLTDTQRWRVVKDYIESETYHVKSCIFAVVLTTLPSGILAGVVFIPYTHILYLVDTLIIMVRVMSFTTCSLFIFQVFPETYFGRLWGMCQCLGAVTGVSYLPLQMVKSHMDEIKLGVATAVFIALSHPVHLLVRMKRLERASINAHPAGLTSPSPDDILFLPVEELRRSTTPVDITALQTPDKTDRAPIRLISSDESSTRF